MNPLRTPLTLAFALAGVIVAGACASTSSGPRPSPPSAATAPSTASGSSSASASNDSAVASTKTPASASSAGAGEASGSSPTANSASLASVAAPRSATSAAALDAPPKGGCPDGMVLVEGGTFRFGLLKSEVVVEPLCVDRTEVTARAYEACVQAGRCSESFLDCAEAKTYRIAGKEEHPIVCVDYPQAKAYCEAQDKRLPTEPEWEWVARSRNEGRRFSFGNGDPQSQVCWSGSTEGTRVGTCPAQSFVESASVDGVVGLTGNVFEWTQSAADPKRTMFVVKGGSWRDGVASQMLITRPSGFKPEYRCGFGGVRCVKTSRP